VSKLACGSPRLQSTSWRVNRPARLEDFLAGGKAVDPGHSPNKGEEGTNAMSRTASKRRSAETTGDFGRPVARKLHCDVGACRCRARPVRSPRDPHFFARRAPSRADDDRLREGHQPAGPMVDDSRHWPISGRNGADNRTMRPGGGRARSTRFRLFWRFRRVRPGAGPWTAHRQIFSPPPVTSAWTAKRK